MNDMDRRDRRGRVSAAVVLAVSLGLVSSGWAQLQPRQDPQRMMADQLRLLVHQSLTGESGMPTADQLTQAQVLLTMALKLAPEDADLWRAQMEVAGWREDSQRRREAVGRLVTLEPDNDAAQLDLIMGSLTQQQTLDQRLARVRRILDAPASRSLSAALRSRLASYAAAAAREMGDSDTFVRRLAQAIKLDPANADAAYMLYELARQRDDAPLYRGAAAIDWVAAAPADPIARFDLGELLLRQALFEEAAAQFQMSVALSTGAPDATQVRLWVTALAMAGQADAALGVLSQVEQVMTRSSPASAATPQGAAAASPSGGLPAELELVRSAIHSIAPQAEGSAGAERSFGHLRTMLSTLADSGDAAARRELAVASAVFGDDLDAALRLAEREDADADTRDLVRGWVALRYGRTTEGRDLLRSLAETDDLAALGLALLEEDVEARASMLETIRRRDPIGVAGLLAVMNLRKDDRLTPSTPIGVSLRERMGRYPDRLWHTDLAFSPWLSLRLHVEPMRPKYLEPLRATVALHNLSGAPLNLTGTIPTRMLVTLSTRGADGAQQPLPPLIVDIGRRLTLGEGERLNVDFRLDRGALGLRLAANPSAPITIEGAAIVDPRTTVDGGVRAGPVGAMDRVRAVQFSNVPATAARIDAWLAGLESPDGAEQLRSIAYLLRALGDTAAEDAQARRDEIGDAIAGQWESFDALRQTWTMRFLPPEAQRPAGLRRVVDLAQRSDDPMVRVVYLASQVRDPSSPAMTAALRHTDPTIGEFARALRDSLMPKEQ